MARKSKPKPGNRRGNGAKSTDAKARAALTRKPFRPLRWIGFIALRTTTVLILGTLALVVLFSVINPPTTHTIWSEKRRLGQVDRQWIALEGIAPVMARAVVAAEDANYCRHWGFDVAAIRAALEEGGARGGSTISQQVVKNVFLWQGRSWLRKALEAAITPAVEAVWTKRRIIEVYLNIAEMGEGVFGVEAAARKYFDVGPEKLTARQAALIAAALPSPKTRNPARPTAYLRKRAAAIADGAATIEADGRAACFQD